MSRRLHLLVVTFLFAAFVFQLWYHATRTSSTFDEPMHTAAGYRYWQCGDFSVNPEHPPLLKFVATIPVYFNSHVQADKNCGTTFHPPRSFAEDWFFAPENHATDLITYARLSAATFSLLLAVLVFLAARQMFGRWEAVVALSLLAFEPNLIAHGSLVTTDMALTATYFASFYALYRYLKSPSVLRCLVVGLAVGATLASKHSGILVLPAIAVVLFAAFLASRKETLGNTLRPQLGSYAMVFAGAILIGFACLWAAYGFRYHALPNAPDTALPIQEKFDTAPPEIASSTKLNIVRLLDRAHIFPEGYVYGLSDVVTFGRRPMFLLGEKYPEGRWFYFPVTFSIKTSIPLLLMLVSGLFAFGLYRERKLEMRVMLLPALLFFGAALTSELTIGVRHILPVYPFFIIVAAAGACYWARKYRYLSYFIILLLVYHAATAFRTAPDYLAFSNDLWGGTSNTWRYLEDSNVEWGQDLKLVDEYVRRNHIDDCWIAAFGVGDIVPRYQPCHTMPAFIWLRADPPIEATPPVIEGTLFISDSVLPPHTIPPAPPFLTDEYATFLNAQPIDQIGGGIFVYRGRFELAGVAAMSHISRAMELAGPDKMDEAITELRQAVALAPDNPRTHQMLGTFLKLAGRVDEARSELETAIKMDESHPGPHFAADDARESLNEIP